MIEIDELWALIDQHVGVLSSEEVSQISSVGRVIAESLVARRHFPAFTHSAMDGYAFAEARPGRCRVIEHIPAGSVPRHRLTPGHAARVLTGAPIPDGTFAVVMQEQCAVADGFVEPMGESDLPEGRHVRHCGAIVREGATIVPVGSLVTPGAVALFASCGVEDVSVFRRPAVLHIATGSELLAPGKVAAPGKIADSNGPMIEALLAQRGMTITREHLPDDANALLEQIKSFSGDLLLISGGSGPGDHDHTHMALEAGGFVIHSTRVNSRPGKPLIFATRGAQVAFGLPGNPLSHWVCFHAFVRRAIERMEGKPTTQLKTAICSVWKDGGHDGRHTWTPARWKITGGQCHAEPLPWLHSGDLSPLLEANALLLDAPDPDTHFVQFLDL